MLLAELARKQQALTGSSAGRCRRARSRKQRLPAPNRASWIGWYFDAAIRAAPPANGSLASPQLKTVRRRNLRQPRRRPDRLSHQSRGCEQARRPRAAGARRDLLLPDAAGDCDEAGLVHLAWATACACHDRGSGPRRGGAAGALGRGLRHAVLCGVRSSGGSVRAHGGTTDDAQGSAAESNCTSCGRSRPRIWPRICFA